MADIQFYRGETWSFSGIAKKRDGSALDLTGGSIEVRIVSSTALILKSISADIDIDTGTNGTYSFNITDDDSRLAAISDGIYTLEVDALAQDGSVSVQNRILCMVSSSARALFP